jgi:hypothetical protein
LYVFHAYNKTVENVKASCVGFQNRIVWKSSYMGFIQNSDSKWHFLDEMFLPYLHNGKLKGKKIHIRKLLGFCQRIVFGILML